MSKSSHAPTSSSPGEDHDHGQCVADAVQSALDLCTQRGTRLTPVRQRVLELIWRSHEPVGAYALLDVLRQEGWNAAPPTVYRALDFLLENGLVHRIESLNAFVGCVDPRHPHQGQHLICRDCGQVVEADDPGVSAAIRALAARSGFAVSRQTVEVLGLCSRCAATPGSP